MPVLLRMAALGGDEVFGAIWAHFGHDKGVLGKTHGRFEGHRAPSGNESAYLQTMLILTDVSAGAVRLVLLALQVSRRPWSRLFTSGSRSVFLYSMDIVYGTLTVEAS